MKDTITGKILSRHLVEGVVEPGESARFSVDQVLTQDATGTMAYLQFEAMGIDRIRLPLAVSYVDHNMLQTSHYNPDDHTYLRTAAARYGAYFSRPGNGICHQVHLERFAVPGAVLLGSDSHTPTAGGVGSLAIGVGGLDVAAAMAGEPFELRVPGVVRVTLTGRLHRPRVMAMDVILEVLRRRGVKGGVGKVFEYTGEGVADLSVPERATITNMGAELGATTSIFPSDDATRRFLTAQGRGDAWVPLAPEKDASYQEEEVIDLDGLEPLMARPNSPGDVVRVSDLDGIKVDQVCIGSCTNSYYQAMRCVASLLRGRTVSPGVSMTVTPGTKQVLEMMAREGELAHIIAAGARILESACGPCIGMGQAPPTGGVSVRSFNRNFRGRSGTPDAKLYLCNPVVAAAIALAGEIHDPGEMNIDVPGEPLEFHVNDNMLIPPPPPEEGARVEVIKGPNIKDVPVNPPLEDALRCEVVLKVGDNISTDGILPAGANILPLRSNIPAISEYVFHLIDRTFPERARAATSRVGGAAVIGGENYGQGSSREHAALGPRYLGVRVKIVRSFARIHRSNLINFGILPLTFADPSDYEGVSQGDVLVLQGLREAIGTGSSLNVRTSSGRSILTRFTLSEKERKILLAGGLLPYIRRKRTA